MTTRKKYTREFKQDAVRLVTEQSYNQSEAARNLGIDRGMLGRWVKELQEDESDAFRGNGKLTSEQAVLRQLREENRRLKMERDILKNPPRAAGGPHLQEKKLVRGHTWGEAGSRGRPLFGGIDPVKKHGPGTIADLCVVTPAGDPD